MAGAQDQQEVVKAARAFASAPQERIAPGRHAKQQRAEAHLKAVAQIVTSVTTDDAVIAAAWLHDIVEDTPVTVRQLEKRFGQRVAALVAELTPVPRAAGGFTGRADARHAVETASPEAKTIKLADLIDTLRDLRRVDPVAACAFAAEARQLTAALADADARLLERLQVEIDRCAEAHEPHAARHTTTTALTLPRRALRAFERAFSADDLAEPLLSFDAGRDGRDVLAEMRVAGAEVAGLRSAGRVSGFVEALDLREGCCASQQREIQPHQIVDANAPPGDVVEVLTIHDWCFVTAFGAVAGVVGRNDLQKPAVRMWLFGIITVAELEATARVARKWPGDGWIPLLSPGRLQKARELYEERQRRHERCRLVDCLQLGDKLELLASDPAELAALGVPSGGAARRLTKQVERLRNSLAHSQAFVEQDWPQVVRLARRVARLPR